MGQRAIGVAAIIIVAALLILHFSRAKSNFVSGPYNLQLYDFPYFYPFYIGRNVTDWDGDKRCASYNSQWPSAVWCR